MSTLERAIVIAALAHSGVRDKAGSPYILHPLRLMHRVCSPDARIAAVLHDVVEDSAWTIDRLRYEGFSEVILDAVDALTRRAGEDYMDFIRRAGENPIAKQVKIADLNDNMDPSRMTAPTQEDHARLDKYQAALSLLQGDAGKT